MSDSTKNLGAWQQVKAILDRALDVASPERLAFIDRECDDPDLKEQVLSVLRAYESVTESKPLPAAQKILATLPATFGPGSEVGPYVLEESLGAGGMGAVFLARRADRAFEKKVAVKLIKRQWASEREIGRFRSERQILANLVHPSIAQLLDGGETEEGQPYLVMEYVEGRSISSYCRDKTLTLDQRLDLFTQVCSAVQFAHQNLIVHRDLKPGNIMVSDDGRVKLLDFGIAKILDAENFAMTVMETQAGGSPMTLAYASPEQVRGQNITTATDVYALGILLYELLTGRRPHHFDGRNLPEAMEAICNLEATAPSEQLRTASGTPPSDLLPDPVPEGLVPWKQIQGDLDAIVLKALAKEPERRYASAEQMAEDLRRFQNHQPVRARRDTLIYRSRKFVYRNRVPLGAAAVVLVVLLTSIALLVQNRRELIRQKNQAETVSAWMTELFELPTPGRSLGEKVTARELLDKSADSIRQDLAQEPEVLARMLLTLGRSYMHLGLYPEGMELIDSGGDLAERYLSSIEVAEFLFASAEGSSVMGEYAAALEDLERAARILDRSPGRHWKIRAECLSLRGAVELRLFRLAEAEASLEAAETAAREADDDEVLSNVLEDFGELYVAQHQKTLAVKKFREALALREGLYEEHHPGVTSLRWNLLTMRGAENPEDASREADRLLERAVRVLGESEVLLANQYFQWAEIKDSVSRHDEARNGYETAMRIAGETLGPYSPHYFPFLSNFGRMELRLGNYERAEALLRRLLGIVEQETGKQGAVYGNTLSLLGSVALDTGRLDEAEAFFAESAQILEDVFGPRHELSVTAANNIGMVWKGRADYEEAGRWFEKAAELGRQSAERPAAMTTILKNLARNYRDLGDFDSAGRIYAELVRDEGMKTLDGIQSLTWQARCFIEVENWSKALEAARRADREWGHWGEDYKTWRVVTWRIQGRALVELGQVEDGLVRLRETLDHRLKTGASADRVDKIRAEIADAEARL